MRHRARTVTHPCAIGSPRARLHVMLLAMAFAALASFSGCRDSGGSANTPQSGSPVPATARPSAAPRFLPSVAPSSADPDALTSALQDAERDCILRIIPRNQLKSMLDERIALLSGLKTGEPYVPELDECADEPDFNARFNLALVRTLVPALSSQPAPGGIGGARLPSDSAGVTALFNRLPEDLAGGKRSPQLEQSMSNFGFSIVIWGSTDAPADGPQMTVQNVAQSYLAGWTGSDVALFSALGAAVETAGYTGPDALLVEARRDGQIVWTRYSIETSPGVRVQIAMWALENSPWLFQAQAQKTEQLDALLSAFAAAAGQ